MIFKIVYWLGIFAEIVIRAPFRNNSKAVKAEQRVSQTEQILLGLLTATGIVFPLIYSVTNWLAFANYGLPAWMGWLGVFVLVCALLIFWRAHADLKSNWSPSLEIFENHALVTKGIYAYIRHPMYTSGYLVAIAQTLLLQNWIAGPLALIAFLFFHLMRVQAEEKMMLDTFGDHYREYMKRTGGVIPRLTK